MAGVSSLLSIGRSALNATQVAIQVTGQNIANVDTDGYSRQSVVLANSSYASGVDVEGITRSYDAFVESQYLEKIAARDRFQSLYNGLSGVESLFNESSTDGVSASLSTFFSDWGDLTNALASNATITAMLEDSQTLASLLRSTSDSLNSLAHDAQTAVSEDVDTLNTLASNIAELNRQIGAAATGTQNYNSLLDSRDALIEQMASLVDVNVIDNGGSDLTVNLTSGQTVVDGITSYSFAYEQGKTVRQLTSTSRAAGSDAQCYYEGSDSSEYTIEVLTPGTVTSNGSAVPATFRVSLDGGATWLTSNSGKEAVFEANAENGKVQVGDLEIWFGSTSNAGAVTANTTLSTGDTFTLVPKKALYWYTTAGTSEIVSPQQYADGTDNARRLTGGSLCGALELVDTYIGGYQDNLDAMTASLVWEANRIYSQGTGETAYGSCTGTYAVANTDVALRDPSSGLAFGDRLASGASMLYVYDADSGSLVSSAAISLNPDTDSLEDVVAAVNGAFGGKLTASIVNGQITLSAADGCEFRFGTDTSGLFAALGVNTLFTGSTASDVALNSTMTTDTGKVCVGHVGTDGLVASGDTTTATAMTGLETTSVSFTVGGKAVSAQTLGDFYSTLVGSVGSDTSAASYQYSYQSTLATSLQEQKLSVSAVSLDEELTNLIMFQHSYQAAAKLISTADSMFQTILGMKN